jgi:hypothetical protein
MAMHLRIIPEAEFLSVVVTGEFSLEEAESTFLDIVGAVSENKSEKVLVDGRELSGDPRKIERFFYGDFAAQMYRDLIKIITSRAPVFAYVLQEPVLDPQRFGETVAKHRGMLVKAFDNLDDALGWLGAG